MIKKLLSKDILRFLIPSICGVIIFLIPVFFDGKPTIVYGIIFDILRSATQDYLPSVVTGLLLISGLCSTYFSVFRKNNQTKSRNRIEQIFTTQISWLTIRILGAIFASLVFFNVGPQWIICLLYTSPSPRDRG